jgi:hypothetical protein
MSEKLQIDYVPITEMFAKWDFDLLKIEFEGLKDPSMSGFSESEIEKITNSYSAE